MIVKNENLLKEFRLSSYLVCEWCGWPCRDMGEVHHWQRRGQGRLDIRINLILLCGAWGNECHRLADEKKIEPARLLLIIAKREQLEPDAIVQEIQRINRLDKDAPRCPNHGKGKYAGYPLDCHPSKVIGPYEFQEQVWCPECLRIGGKS